MKATDLKFVKKLVVNGDHFMKTSNLKFYHLVKCSTNAGQFFKKPMSFQTRIDFQFRDMDML